jgi:hypothetical protein
LDLRKTVTEAKSSYRSWFLKNPADCVRLGGRMPKGVCCWAALHGQTLLAKAVAGNNAVERMAGGVRETKQAFNPRSARLSSPITKWATLHRAFLIRRGIGALGYTSSDEYYRAARLLPTSDAGFPAVGVPTLLPAITPGACSTHRRPVKLWRS